jgi:G:T/U-mismatch repair DNA glycosylase
MMPPEYLRKHIDALLRLSHAVKDQAVSAELREMADECRIMLSVADISELAAGLNQAPAELNGTKRH